MSTRSVRLDDEAENALADIVNCTGLSISDAIKQGLINYREIALKANENNPAQFFEGFDLGEGGYAIAPARKSKQVLKNKLKQKRKSS